MPRNREIFLFSAGAAVITVTAAAFCVFSHFPPVLICVCGCVSVCVLCLIFSLRRYRDIARLGAYLQKLARGENPLDIRDNAEGELSILKNEIYKVTAALTEQAAALVKDKRELARALADISHQLKTPLTAMGIMADILGEDGVPPEKRREFINNMRSSLGRMEWLVLTLLKMARLDSDMAEMKRESVALSSLVERALEFLLIPMEIKGQTLSCEGSGADVVCDPAWTGEALENILKNASENTPEGGHIGISCGENPLYSFISVRDGGPGIDKADMPHLFRRFYRGKNAGNGSVGIGLAMSLAVMRKQGGDIEVRNDGGAVFTLKFYKTNPK